MTFLGQHPVSFIPEHFLQQQLCSSFGSGDCEAEGMWLQLSENWSLL